MQLFPKGLDTTSTDQYTTTASCKSVELSNLSHFVLSITGLAGGTKVLPAFATKQYLCPPNTYLSFALQPSPLNPASMPGEYVQVDESTSAVESGITALAMVPVYTSPVSIQDGTVTVEQGTVDVASMPPLVLQPGQQIVIQNGQIEVTSMPAMTFAAGATIGIDATANQIEIVNEPGVTIQNEAVGTDVGQGMTRDVAGGIFFAQNTGITTVTFAEAVTQVYLQNQATTSGIIYVTGDEDPGMTSNGISLMPGDSMGLSWKTKHLFIKGSAAQLPLQVQGWY